MIVFIALWFISMLLCHLLAKYRRLNPIFWVQMAAIFGPLTIPLVLLYPPQNKP